MLFKIKYIYFIIGFVALLCQQTFSQITITADGNQIYCPLSPINIVTDFNIIDTSSQIDALYIQISTGYTQGEDTLTLTGNHPNITAEAFNVIEGKLILRWSGLLPVNYTELIAAVKEVVFESSSSAPNDKTFSITISDANYLPSTGHFYEYISSPGITWTDAEVAAESLNYFGLQGYLATITSAEEAQLSGEQAAGAGWIGGSDSETEGVWKWVTGPENGMVFWNGTSNGSSPAGVYSNWNTNEPNQLGNEDYAHVTAPGVGSPGSWNDLSNTGAASGDYQPKGYIVEYGGMPGDPTVNLSAFTTISTAFIESSSGDSVCNSGSVTLSATASTGDVLWFDSDSSLTPLQNGTDFSTPIISTTTTYYVLASVNGCLTGERTPVVATVYDLPTITSAPDKIVCGAGSKTLSATASNGVINWYDNLSGGISIFEGENFETPFITESTTYYIDATANGCVTPIRTPITLHVQYDTIPIEVNISLDDLTIVDNSPNNSITINNVADLGDGDYTFSLNEIEGPFSSSSMFENVAPGIHTIYIMDNDICGIAQIDVPVLGFPKFFTPNNDHYNDLWQIKGVSADTFKNSPIYIFNRFGKIIAVIDLISSGWDGTFNGKTMSSGDYWFKVQLTDLNENTVDKKGHFSLIRK